MSSVGNSDSADRADKNQLRRTRDEFRQRESDLIKRQNVEARRVAEHNQDEISSLKEKHGEAMDAAREHSHEAITSRDHQYQREIEDIRNIHRKQLQTSADETSRREGTLRKALKNDSGLARKHAEERFERLSGDYEKKSRAEAEAYGKLASTGREGQDKAINTVRNKLNEQHEREMDSLRTTLQDKVSKAEGDFSDYRRETSGQQREAQIRTVQQGRDQSEKLMSAVRTERLDRAQNEEHLRDDYRESIEETRERFGAALEERDEAAREASSNFRASSEDRQVGKINSLKRENKELHDNNAREVQQVKHQAGRELIGAKKSFQKNVEAYRRERDEAYVQGNKGNRDEVLEVREELEREVREGNRDNKIKLDDQTRNYKREFENIKGEYEGRLAAQGQLTDARVEHVATKLNEEKNHLTQLNEDNFAAAQRNKREEMKALRATLEGDKRGSVDTMREMMRKQELRHADRMGAVVSKYDKQVQALKDELVRERKLSGEANKRTVEEMQRAHQLEIDQFETKSRSRLNEVNARHDQDVRAVSKRYEEKLDQVLAEMKKS